MERGVASVILACADDGLDLAVLFELLEVLFQFVQKTRRFVEVEFEDGVHLVGGARPFGLEFLFGFGNFELERGDDCPCTELAQVWTFGAQSDVLVGEQ